MASATLQAHTPSIYDDAPHSVKRRAACEECRNRKLKCSGTQPECTRCSREGITCFYSLQKTMGRPKKRARSSDYSSSTPSRSRDATGPQQQDQNQSASALTSGGLIQPWLDDHLPVDVASSFHSPDSITVPALTPDNASLDLDSAIPHPHYTTIPTASCACLSTLYLTLSTLNTLNNPLFPSALHPLRSAMSTAKTVLSCPECPKSFTTGLQNTTLLGTLFLSIAERFSKLLHSIDLEAARAENAGEKKRFRLTDLNGENGTHLHLGGAGCLAAFSMVMSPAEWKAMCKRVVRAEVEGPDVDGGEHVAEGHAVNEREGHEHEEHPSFLSLTKQMEERQRQWHTMPLPRDSPQGVREMFRSNTTPTTTTAGKKSERKEEEYHCLKLVGSSRTLVRSFNWS